MAPAGDRFPYREKKLLLNTVPDRGHWLLVHREGTKNNRSAYGSVVEVVPGGQRSARSLKEGGGEACIAGR
jgi:hypothetical protein